MNKFIRTLILPTLFLVSCKKDKADPEISVVNGNIENKMEGWEFGSEASDNKTPNDYGIGFTAEASSSPQYSLKINCNDVTNLTSFGYFVQKLPGANIAKGAKVTLRVKVKTSKILGKGISIGLRGDKNGSQIPVFFETTEGNLAITGTNDFKTYEAVLDSYPGQIDTLLIYLVYLPETTGAVYFDDIQLVIN